MKLIKSWIESANTPDTHFPLNNLPFGVYSCNGSEPVCCTAIGDHVLDLAKLFAAGFFPQLSHNVFANPALNEFMALGPASWQAIRDQLQDCLAEENTLLESGKKQAILNAQYAISAVQLHLPFKVSEFTDFYSGRQHAQNVGTMFRGPENALPPNWLHIPIGYNGRASTVVVSGTDVRRPLGQIKPPDTEAPVFGPCKRLDIELEMGAVVGLPSEMGKPLSVRQADDLIFGYVLLNDWSARDIQAWEYQPLGPFQAKVFATSISPWVVTKAALADFRVSTPERDIDLLPYLRDCGPMLYNIELQAQLQPASSDRSTTLSQTNYSTMYYSAAQQLAHHAIGGCRMNTGDLLGSGTISGAEKSALGSMLEMSWGGKNPIALEGGGSRTFVEDGDTLTLTGYAQAADFRIGFGECSGTILPAPDITPC